MKKLANQFEEIVQNKYNANVRVLKSTDPCICVEFEDSYESSLLVVLRDNEITISYYNYLNNEVLRAVCLWIQIYSGKYELKTVYSFFERCFDKMISGVRCGRDGILPEYAKMS